jgi:RNA polymerase sigma factor (sigma-70 family)
MQAPLVTEISDPAQLIQDSVLIIRQSAILAFKYYNHATTEDEIGDICQQIILQLIEDHYRRLRLFDSRKSSFRTWLKSVARHHISNYLRQKKTLSLDELPLDSVSYPPNQEDLIILRDRNERLEAILGKLSTRDQQIIRLLCFEGRSAIDVARIMRMTVGSVYWHKHNIIKRLRDDY